MGFMAFWAVCGFKILNPTYFGWLAANDDPFQHLIGWLFFKDSPWSFPLGLNPNFGLSISSSIVYSDSIPLFAFLFKPFAKLLPSSFQYLGIWTLLCFILQAVFSWKLLNIASKSILVNTLVLPLFIFSPIMMNRIGMHSALAGHFLILAGLYLNLRVSQHHRSLLWPLLIAICALTHFYLLALVLGLWMASLLDTDQHHQASKKELISEVGVVLVVLFITMWQAGYFSVGLSSVSGGGYGIWAMNLLSFFNAKGWSYLLPVIPGVESVLDNFQYPGIGVLLVLIFALFKPKTLRALLIQLAKTKLWFLILIIAFAIFSVSNYVGIGPIRLHFELPKFLLAIGNTFRSSDRFFWPAAYLLTLVGVAVVIKGYSKSAVIIIFLSASLLQIVDTNAGWGKLNERLNKEMPLAERQKLKSNFWEMASKNYKKTILAPVGTPSINWRVFSLFSAEHQIGTTGAYLARVDSRRLSQLQSNLQNGLIDKEALYIIEPEALPSMLSGLDFEHDLLAVVDGYIVLAPGWRDCVNCDQAFTALNLNEFLRPTQIKQEIFFNKASEINKDYRLNGWSKTIESWGTWSNGTDSQIIIPLPKNAHVKILTLNLRAFVNQRHPTQKVDIRINGSTSYSFSLSSFEDNKIVLPITPLSLKQGYVSLKFEFPNAASPKQLGLGDDDRVLAIGLKSALFD